MTISNKQGKRLPHFEMMKRELGRMNECKQVTWTNGEISNSDFTILHSSFRIPSPIDHGYVYYRLPFDILAPILSHRRSHN
jgi:hypothetical protein